MKAYLLSLTLSLVTGQLGAMEAELARATTNPECASPSHCGVVAAQRALRLLPQDASKSDRQEFFRSLFTALTDASQASFDVHSHTHLFAQLSKQVTGSGYVNLSIFLQIPDGPLGQIINYLSVGEQCDLLWTLLLLCTRETSAAEYQNSHLLSHKETFKAWYGQARKQQIKATRDLQDLWPVRWAELEDAPLGHAHACTTLIERFRDLRSWEFRLLSEADLNAPEIVRYSPLIQALWARNDKAVRLIMKRGVDLGQVAEGNHTALSVAFVTENAPIIEELIERGAPLDVPASAEQHGGYLLVCAQIKQPWVLPIVPMLLERGVLVDEARRSDGLTPLMCAAMNNNLGVLTCLLKAGAAVEATTANGMTPLLYAVQSGAYDCVKALVGAGANIDTQSKDGYTVDSLAKNSSNPVMKEFFAGVRMARAMVEERRQAYGENPR